MDSSNDTLIPDLTTMEIETQSDDSESSGSGSSVFKTQCDPSSLKEKLEKPLRTFVCSPERVQITDSSSGSDWEPRPLTLKAVFEQFKQKKRKKKKKKYKPYGRSQGRRKARTPRRTSQIDKKQFRAKGPGFSFLETENVRNPIPWKKILTFEQAVARGFFKYLEKLKYEHHLKESLKLMNVGEDLEKDDLDSRIYKYLDDDGSLSPIEDTVLEDEDTKHSEECDIKLVEENCFIINYEFPKGKVHLHGDGATLFCKKKSIKSSKIVPKDRIDLK